MSRPFIASLLIAGLLAPPAFAKIKDLGDFTQVELVDNISQLIRSNALHYWSYVKRANVGDLKRYAEFEGLVAGDPHLGNFSVVPAETNAGQRVLRYLDIDFDDAGVGPFAFDFARLMITSEAINSEVKKKDLEQAYVAGLNGRALAAPAVVHDLLTMGLDAYDQEVSEYVAKNVSGDRFLIREGKVAAYDGSITKGDVAPLFARAGQRVLDLAQRPKERGGSADGLRLWVLVDSGGEAGKRIFELKSVEKSGLTGFAKQNSMSSLLDPLREVFWPGLSGASYDIVRIPGAGEFWLREKRKALIDIPYSSAKAKKIAFIKELAVYDANLLGLAHGRQASAAPYVAMINDDPAAFHEAIQPLVKAYLVAAQSALR